MLTNINVLNIIKPLLFVKKHYYEIDFQFAIKVLKAARLLLDGSTDASFSLFFIIKEAN